MRVKKITDVLKIKVFTDSGDFFGEVEEVNLNENKIDGWRIRVNKIKVVGRFRKKFR